MTKSWLSAQGKLPLAFMALALLWLGTAIGLLAGHGSIFLQAHWLPIPIALTHSFVLGFLATVACGAVYQLVPVALSTTLWTEKLGWAHFWLHAIGVPGMVIFFWSYNMPMVGIFGTLVTIGTIFYVLNALMTVLKSKRTDVIAIGIALATIWLFFAVLAGLFILGNRLWGWVPGDPLRLLRAHAHIGLVGFFVTLIQGVGFQLVPMFTMGQVQKWGSAKAGVWLGQGGLLALIIAFVGQWQGLQIAGAAAITLGLLCSAAGIIGALKTRKKKRLDPGVAVFLRGGIGLIVAAIIGTILASGGASRGLATLGFSPMIYIVIGLFGGLLPCVTGMMCKVVPFLTWMRSYGPLVGRVKTPPAHSLTKPRLERWGLGLQQLAALPLAVGAWLGSSHWISLGLLLLVIGIILFLIDMYGVFRHLWAPVVTKDSPPLFPPRPAPATNEK